MYNKYFDKYDAMQYSFEHLYLLLQNLFFFIFIYFTFEKKITEKLVLL